MKAKLKTEIPDRWKFWLKKRRNLEAVFRALAKEAVYRIQPSLILKRLPRYSQLVHPAGLSLLCACIDKTASLPGPIVEVGCSWGSTTLFLAKHMACEGVRKTYYAMDTFSGFRREHIDLEVEHRAKDRNFLLSAFKDRNTRVWFERTMNANGFPWVKTIEADVADYDFVGISDISFAFLDVDLYIPIKAALNKVYGRMARGGIIAVHDCKPGTPWDGALAAYIEFVRAVGREPRIEAGLMGMIYC